MIFLNSTGVLPMKFRYAIALACLAIPSGLSAQNFQVQVDRTLIENFDGKVVEEALAPFKVNTQTRLSEGAAPAVVFTFDGGLVATAQPLACKNKNTNTGCSSLRLSVVFGPPTGKTAAQIAQMVNAFNATHETSQVVYDKDGRTRLVTYVIADYGITKTNLVGQLFNFRQSTMVYAQALAKPAAG